MNGRRRPSRGRAREAPYVAWRRCPVEQRAGDPGDPVLSHGPALVVAWARNHSSTASHRRRAHDKMALLDLQRFASSGDMIGPLLAGWRDETNRLSPQRPWPA
jgi:hypothetical protein